MYEGVWWFYCVRRTSSSCVNGLVCDEPFCEVMHCVCLSSPGWRLCTDNGCQEGRTEVVSLLVKAGANTDLQNKDGDSALMMAAREGRTEVVSLLLEAGANTDLQNKDGYSALMIAASSCSKTVPMLVKAGAALDLQNKEGDTAVIMATLRYHLPVSKELVRAGADLNLQNQEGLTALMISSRSGRTDLTEILLSGEIISLDIQSVNWMVGSVLLLLTRRCSNNEITA
ncbi:Putative ankyrin repeat protein MM_0045 [Geodia barretti]|uniref:Ankyrin repeat protein MM_0045 n=1 Tax=Geodia barretti TaxID=519541 RepID=A0AA35S1S0_GEOBA|nr:Putative ankyrin repeat protein MM_0045 [Geodia barretti]